MGTQITTQYRGSCHECDEAWKPGDKIYFDGDHKNSVGKSTVCTDIDCFKEQGGKLDTDSSSEYKFNPPKKINTDVMIQLDTNDEIMDTIIVKADNKTKELYPNLKGDSSVFGQIRNSWIDKYLKLYLVKYK